MILEGLVTSTDLNGTAHIAAMGADVDDDLTRFVLRPYRTSRTFQNLASSRTGVFHLTDDVELIARAAIHRLDRLPPMKRASHTDAMILEDACRWFAFRVETVDTATDRARMECLVVDQGRIRDFLGFNRAKHAVLEAAILATRVQWLDEEQIVEEFRRLTVIVEKTAGQSERRAFACLQSFVSESLASARENPEPPSANPRGEPRPC